MSECLYSTLYQDKEHRSVIMAASHPTAFCFPPVVTNPNHGLWGTVTFLFSSCVSKLPGNSRQISDRQGIP